MPPLESVSSPADVTPSKPGGGKPFLYRKMLQAWCRRRESHHNRWLAGCTISGCRSHATRNQPSSSKQARCCLPARSRTRPKPGTLGQQLLGHMECVTTTSIGKPLPNVATALGCHSFGPPLMKTVKRGMSTWQLRICRWAEPSCLSSSR